MIETDAALWEPCGGAQLAREALDATIGPHRGAAVATKLLHLKRPRFFPVLDDLVAQMLGVNAPGDPTREQRVEITHRLLLHLRDQGRKNLEPLRAIQDALANDGIQPLACTDFWAPSYGSPTPQQGFRTPVAS